MEWCEENNQWWSIMWGETTVKYTCLTGSLHESDESCTTITHPWSNEHNRSLVIIISRDSRQIGKNNNI